MWLIIFIIIQNFHTIIIDKNFCNLSTFIYINFNLEAISEFQEKFHEEIEEFSTYTSPFSEQ